MKQPAASPGRAEKQLPAPPGLARLLLSKSRRGARSRRAPAASPMFVSRGRSAGRAAAAAEGEPTSPKVTCIGQVRMRKGKGKKGKKGAAAAPARAAPPEKARGYCRCLKKAFLCGGLFDFDRSRRHKAPSPEVERTRRSPWVFSSRDVAVAAAPKPSDPRRDRGEEDELEVGVGVFGSVERDEAEEVEINGSDDKEDEEEEEEAELVSSATTTPPKNALLLMRCRSAPQNGSCTLTSRFAAPSPTQDMGAVEMGAAPRASPSPRKADMAAGLRESPSPRKRDMAAALRASPSPRKAAMAAAPWASPSPLRAAEKVVAERENEKWPEFAVVQEQEEGEGEEEDQADEEEEEMRCSSARPLVLPRCKSEPATTAAAKMAAGIGPEVTPSGCFWANGGSSGRRRHAPAPPAAATAASASLTGH